MKEIFPRGEYNKLKLKKIGPCNILEKFSENAYVLELPIVIGISPIFNVVDLYPYQDDDKDHPLVNYDRSVAKGALWVKHIPVEDTSQIEEILDAKFAKKTRGKEIYEYLVKWKGHPKEDSTWMRATDIQKNGHLLEDLMSRSS